MNQAIFIDTSILCNLLDIPGKAQERQQVVSRFKTLQEKKNCHGL